MQRLFREQQLPSTSAATLLARTLNMSPSSTGDSPHSGSGAVTGNQTGSRPFPLPSRDGFSIDIPSPQLTASNGPNNLKSPTSLKSARTPSFSREGILGAAQKARNLVQPSDNNRQDNMSNGPHKTSSDEGMNPLKRRNTDAGVDYPRRRATIAVCAMPAQYPLRERRGRVLTEFVIVV